MLLVERACSTINWLICFQVKWSFFLELVSQLKLFEASLRKKFSFMIDNCIICQCTSIHLFIFFISKLFSFFFLFKHLQVSQILLQFLSNLLPSKIDIFSMSKWKMMIFRRNIIRPFKLFLSSFFSKDLFNISQHLILLFLFCFIITYYFIF